MSERTVAFEVYIRSKGRWVLHARHGAISRKDAIAEAQALERLSHVDAVRVVREAYDDGAGSSREIRVYENPKSSAGPRPTDEAADDMAALEAAFGPVEFEPRSDEPAQSSSKRNSKGPAQGGEVRRGFLSLLTIITISLVISLLLTIAVALAVDELPEVRRMIGLRQTGYNVLLFVVFILSFAISLGTSAYRIFGRTGYGLAAGAKPSNHSAISSSQNSNMGAGGPTNSGQATELLPMPPLGSWWWRWIFRLRRGRPASARAEKRMPRQSTTIGDSTIESLIGPVPEDDLEGELSNVKLSASAESQKTQVMNFLVQGLRPVVEKQPKLNQYDTLGVHLYLAGACEVTGGAAGLNEDEVLAILYDGVRVLGTSDSQAQKFSRSLDSYLLEPKYLTMIEAGRAAMEAHGTGLDASQMLASALETWNHTFVDSETASDTIAVMFTDIDDTIGLTQTHGDDVAVELVRLHDRLARDALTLHQGHEVKHTGGGIMASFASPRNAIGAAIDIQQKVAIHNLNATIPLRLKIGINAGEPIAEGGDLFGTTVQLAARIAEFSTPGHVFASDIVRKLCDGAAFKFADHGPQSLKGFIEPVALYEVQWDQPEASVPGDDEVADAPVQPTAGA